MACPSQHGARVAQRAAFVAERGYSGPLFNDFNWGGYLIWALPQLPVAIDGRTNLHGDERIQRFGSTWAGSPSFSAVIVFSISSGSPSSNT